MMTICIAAGVIGFFVGVLLTIGWISTECTHGHCDYPAPPMPKKRPFISPEIIPGGIH